MQLIAVVSLLLDSSFSTSACSTGKHHHSAPVTLPPPTGCLTFDLPPAAVGGSHRAGQRPGPAGGAVLLQQQSPSGSRGRCPRGMT